jgi:hypothetical protein
MSCVILFDSFSTAILADHPNLRALKVYVHVVEDVMFRKSESKIRYREFK